MCERGCVYVWWKDFATSAGQDNTQSINSGHKFHLDENETQASN